MEVLVRDSIEATEKADHLESGYDEPNIVTPGQIILTDTGNYLRGHGTYLHNNQLLASVAGVVEKVNQLISVRPLVSRYIGEVGDIVVGRIAEVGSKRWKVDVNGQQHALLLLSAVYLPGGAQRRRTYEDQLQMRSFFEENDLISAEIQEVRYDGTLTLHTRSLRYGKLENGQFVRVSPALIKRMKQHMVSLQGDLGVDLIIGANGYIWITRTMQNDQDSASNLSQQSSTTIAMEAKAEYWAKKKREHAMQSMTPQQRKNIALVYKAIIKLNEQHYLITPDSILATCQNIRML